MASTESNCRSSAVELSACVFSITQVERQSSSTARSLGLLGQFLWPVVGRCSVAMPPLQLGHCQPG